MTETPVDEVIRRMDVSEQTLHRWKKVYDEFGAEADDQSAFPQLRDVATRRAVRWPRLAKFRAGQVGAAVSSAKSHIRSRCSDFLA